MNPTEKTRGSTPIDPISLSSATVAPHATGPRAGAGVRVRVGKGAGVRVGEGAEAGEGNPTAAEPSAHPTILYAWRRTVTLAGLLVLGLTPWAQAQFNPLDPPPAVLCPPLTAIATPTLFDVFFGTLPIRFPFQ